MAPKKIKFIDLSIPIESVPSDPEFMIPQIEYTDHRGGLVQAQEILGCQPEGAEETASSPSLWLFLCRFP